MSIAETFAEADRLVLAVSEAQALLGDGKVITMTRTFDIARRWNVDPMELMYDVMAAGSRG